MDLDLMSMLNDKLLSQDLHQKFLIEISDVLIVVVNKMSYSDQKLLFHILETVELKDKQRKDNRKTFVIILHNFFNLNTREIVEHYIDKDILRGFHTVTEKFLDNKYENRIFLTENSNVVHAIMANKYSEAGKFYNSSTLLFIKEHITNIVFKANIDLVQAFYCHLNNNIFDYYKDFEGKNIFCVKKKKVIYFFLDEDDKKIEEFCKEGKFIYNEDDKGKLQENEKNDVEGEYNNKEEEYLSNDTILEVLPFKPSLQNPKLNTYGFVSNKKIGEELDYEIRRTLEDIIFLIRIPGITSNSIDESNIKLFEEGESWGIKFKVNIDNDFEERKMSKQYYSNNKNINKKELSFCSINIPLLDFKIDFEKRNIKFIKNGLICIEIKIQKIQDFSKKFSFKKNKNK